MLHFSEGFPCTYIPSPVSMTKYFQVQNFEFFLIGGWIQLTLVFFLTRVLQA